MYSQLATPVTGVSLGVVLTGLNRARAGAAYHAYWLRLHATIAARTPADLYRVHLIHPTSPLLLATPREVDSYPPGTDQFGGIAELRFDTLARAEAWKLDRAVALANEDEQNNFSHVAAYWSEAGQAFAAKDEMPGLCVDGPQGLPTYVVFARRAAQSERAAFRSYIRSVLAASLAAADGVARVGVYLLEPYTDEWGSPNVDHDEAGREYEAWIEITFKRLDDVEPVLTSANVRDALSQAGGVVAALHGYHEYETYTFRFDGRPTLSGLRGYEIAHTAMAAGALNQLGREVTQITTGKAEWLST